MILDPTTLNKLEQLSLVADQIRVGVMKGDRRSRKRGSSVEFADYRNYVRGDDLRRLDWNIYARLERPFIKLLEEEEDLAVHLLVDASRSMDWPQPPGDAHKLTYALRLAAAIGHIALSGGDQLRAALLTSHDDGLSSWGPMRGAQNSMHLFRFLEATPPTSAARITNLDLPLRAYALRSGRPGLLFLLSDMFTDHYRDGLSALLSRGFELVILHLLSPDEQHPPLSGDLKLVDIENDSETEISIDATVLHQYRQRLQQWQAQIAAFCSQRGAHYIPIDTGQPWDQVVLQTFRRRGIAR